MKYNIPNTTASTHPTNPEAGEFIGFTPLDANFIWCPNQFFDVCLSQTSLVGLRTVGCILFHTLNWIRPDGTPVEDDITTPHSMLVAAGVSKGSIKKGIAEATTGRYIQRLSTAKKTSATQPAKSAIYRMHWSQLPHYTTCPNEFDGFYSGEGCRTPVPKEFFEQILTSENHSVIKFVGTLIRHTIGYQNKFGGRRSVAPLSVRFVQQYANIRDRDTALRAGGEAVERGFANKEHTGGPGSAACYSLNWLEKANAGVASSIIQPDGSEIQPPLVQASHRKQVKNPTGVGSQNQPEPFTKPTNIKKTNSVLFNNKQPDDVVESESYQLLHQNGVEDSMAKKLAATFSFEQIKQQVEWLPAREADNPAGFLIKAIEKNYSSPKGNNKSQTNSRAFSDLLPYFEKASPADINRWHAKAIEAAPQNKKQYLSGSFSNVNPPKEILHQMAIELGLMQASISPSSQ